MAFPVPPSGPLSSSEIYILQGELVTTALQFWLHGLYMTLLCIAVYNLITHKAAVTARKGLLVATFVMFVCSNLQVIEQLAFNVLQLLTLGDHPPNIAVKLLNIRLSLNVFGRVNYLMSDAIVVWRAWLLYHDNLKVRILLGLCLLGSLAGATTHMTFGTLWLYGNLKLDPSGSRALIMVLPLLVTNVVATSFMAYKVWQYRQQIKAQLDLPKDKTTKVERILVILTESGTIYCLIWIPFLYTSLTNQGEDTIGYKIVANIIPQLSAIYPIVIVLLVSLDRKHLEFTITSSPSHPIRFMLDGTGTRTGTGNSPNATSLCLDAMHSDEDSNSDVAVTKEKGVEPVPLRDYL